MQTKKIDLQEAQAHLAELLPLVAAGTEIILTKGDSPMARLVPMTMRTADLHPGAIQTSDDFDEPLPDEFWTGTR